MKANQYIRKESLEKGKKEKGRKNLLIFCMMVLFQVAAFGQSLTEGSYWVQLKDKNGTAYQIDHPENFLSQRAIDRRTRQHIDIDETDLPVSSVYLDSLKKLGLEIVHTSKWLNGATVRTSDTTLIKQIPSLSFVVKVELTRPAKLLKSAQHKFSDEEVNFDETNYGSAINQLTQLNGQYLHRQGFRGKGIQIAILDAGFWHVNEIAAFDSLRSTNRILGTHDFVDPESDIYQQHSHGTSVLSCMGGNQPNNLIGTAPDASFYLFRSEDTSSEYLIEEDNWVAAAEMADSVGVDVINSSLGYYEFNDSKMNHNFSDLDGKSARATQGANMAFRKGILVFNSAGNEGNDVWRRIIVPSDGENVIAVGAVDKSGIRASFSSVGPAFGGAVKPNVAALGSSTYLVTGSGTLGFSSGTSFSSPVLAGMGACLIQANPYANVSQLKMAIEQSASQYSAPDSLLGYGIPDFEKADQYLKVNYSNNLKSETGWIVSPNPFSGYLLIQNQNPVFDENGTISIFDLHGNCLYQSTFKTSAQVLLNNLPALPEGLMIMSIRSGEKEERVKIIKVNR
jgi:serine protease AprX